MSLVPGEPAAGPWRVATVDELVTLVFDAVGAPARGPAVVAVDGRSAAGKTTLAGRLAGAVPASAVVHTDDVAWNHSFFDWADLLVAGVLEPARRGLAVRYRPPAWREHGRPGAIEVPEGCDLLVLEGVGAGRRELGSLLDAVIWVQSDVGEAQRRGIARDVALGGHGGPDQTTAFWEQWMAEELPFLEHQRPWVRASVFVAGASPAVTDPDQVVLATAVDRVQHPASAGR